MILQMQGRVIRLPLQLVVMALACSAIELDASNYHDKTEGKVVFLKVRALAFHDQMCASLIGLLDSSLHLVSDSVIESWKLAADS